MRTLYALLVIFLTLFAGPIEAQTMLLLETGQGAAVVGGGGGGDPYFSSVTALLHFEGTNGGTTFTDQKGHTFTANGGAVTSTAQFKYGSSSGLFNGTNASLSTGVNADFQFATDFTIELFVRLTSVGQTATLWSTDNSTGGPLLYISGSTNKLNFYYGGNQIVSDTVLSPTTWYHIALARSGNSTRMFIDGVTQSTVYSDSNNYSGGNLQIGVNSGDWLAGNIDEFRITKGVARYTGDFTPPAAQFPDS